MFFFSGKFASCFPFGSAAAAFIVEKHSQDDYIIADNVVLHHLAVSVDSFLFSF